MLLFYPLLGLREANSAVAFGHIAKSTECAVGDDFSAILEDACGIFVSAQLEKAGTRSSDEVLQGYDNELVTGKRPQCDVDDVVNPLEVRETEPCSQSSCSSASIQLQIRTAEEWVERNSREERRHS